MTTRLDPSEPVVAATDQPQPSPLGTWTIDPALSSVSVAWRKPRLRSVIARLHCLGVVHLDVLPPVGVVRCEQPSGLPVLTMALDPASVETHDADLDARLRSPDVFDVRQHRWWTLRSESLEILPTGAWRVMATLTANGNSGLLELRFEVDPEASSADWLLRGHGVLDRRAFWIGSPASTFSPQIRLNLAVRARRVGAHIRTQSLTAGATITDDNDNRTAPQPPRAPARAHPAQAVPLRQRTGLEHRGPLAAETTPEVLDIGRSSRPR